MPAEILGSLIGQASAAQVANMQQNKNFRDNIMLWRMQQDYNLPVNQVARLREAKLSPHSIYGHSSPVNTASQAPAPIDYATSHAVAQQGVNTMMQIMQMEKMKAEIKNINADTEGKGVVTGINQIEKDFRAKTLGLSQQQQERGIQLLKAQEQLTFNMSEVEEEKLLKTIAETAGLETDNLQKSRMNPKIYEQAVENILKTAADAAYTKAMTTKVPYEKRLLINQAEELKARAANLYKDTELKQFAVDLSKMNLTPNDHVILRLLLGEAMKDGKLTSSDIMRHVGKDKPLDMGLLNFLID